MEVVDVDRAVGVVTAEGRFYDCERNVGFALRKRRRIVAKKIDADSIQITGDAINSIAFRDVVLRCVPKALWKPVWDKSKATAVGQAKSMEVIRAQMVEHFTKLGITTLQIFNALEVQGLVDIGPDQIIALNAWKKQLAEGDSTIEEIFGFKDEAEANDLMQKLGWNAAKQQMCKSNYKGRSSEMMDYLRSEVQKAGRGQEAQQQKQGSAQATQQGAQQTTATDPGPSSAQHTPAATGRRPRSRGTQQQAPQGEQTAPEDDTTASEDGMSSSTSTSEEPTTEQTEPSNMKTFPQAAGNQAQRDWF